MDAHVRRQDGMVHLAAGNDDAGGDDESVAWPGGRGGMHELRRRQVAGQRVDRPFGVVQVELRHIGDQIHMRIVELLQRAHVTPVGVVGWCGSRNLVGIEIVDAGLVACREIRRDVAAHIMLRILGLLIQRKRREQGIGVGHIVAMEARMEFGSSGSPVVVCGFSWKLLIIFG